MTVLLPGSGAVFGFLNPPNASIAPDVEKWMVGAVLAVEKEDHEALKNLLNDPIEKTIAWDECIFLVDDDGGGPGSHPEYYNLAALACSLGNIEALKVLVDKRPLSLREKPARVIHVNGRENLNSFRPELLDFTSSFGLLPATRLLIAKGYELKDPDNLRNRVWKWPEELLEQLLARCEPHIIASPERWAENLLDHAATWCRTLPDYADEVAKIQKRFSDLGVPIPNDIMQKQIHRLAREENIPDRITKKHPDFDKNSRSESERLTWLLHHVPNPFVDEYDAANLFVGFIKLSKFNYANALLEWAKDKPFFERKMRVSFWSEVSNFEDMGGLGQPLNPDSNPHEYSLFKELLQKIAYHPLNRPELRFVRAWKKSLEAGVKAADHILAAFLDKKPELAITEWAEFTSPSLIAVRERLKLSAMAKEVRESIAPSISVNVNETLVANKKVPGSKRRV